MTERERILDAVSESTLERLEDGETLELLVETNDPNPLIDDDRPRSMTTLELRLDTKGVIDDRSLSEAYPEVIGLYE
jgi:hypothetical protein